MPTYMTRGIITPTHDTNDYYYADDIIKQIIVHVKHDIRHELDELFIEKGMNEGLANLTSDIFS